MANISIFFTLPLELRNEIYAYLVVGWHDVATPSPIDGISAREYKKIGPFLLDRPHALMDMAWADVSCDDFDLNWLDYPRPLMATPWADRKNNESESNVRFLPKHDYSILRVSRQMHEEASNMLYDFSIFTFSYAVLHLNKKSLPRLEIWKEIYIGCAN